MTPYHGTKNLSAWTRDTPSKSRYGSTRSPLQQRTSTTRKNTTENEDGAPSALGVSSSQIRRRDAVRRKDRVWHPGKPSAGPTGSTSRRKRTMNPTELVTSVPGHGSPREADTQNRGIAGANVTLSIPIDVALTQTLAPRAVGVLVHLLACGQCHTVHDLCEHGQFGRASTRTDLDDLTRHGYYHRDEITTAAGDTLVTVEVASRPYEFGPPVTISRVYFAGRGGLIKIGTTVHLRLRIRQLGYDGGPVTLLTSIPGGPVLEEKLHRRFAAHRHQGEWFHDCAPLRQYLDSLTTAPEVAA